MPIPAAAAVPAATTPAALRGSLASESALRAAFSSCSRDGFMDDSSHLWVRN
jgi:hypothetical protein